MANENLEIRGAPHVTVDGGRLASDRDETVSGESAANSPPLFWRSGPSLVLVVLADFLFWSHEIGLSAARWR